MTTLNQYQDAIIIEVEVLKSTGTPIPARPIMTIEEKYSVDGTGQDWFEVYIAAPFKRGQRCAFVQGSTRNVGTVVDVAYRQCAGEVRYDFQVKYDSKPIPRWTHPKWLKAL